MKCHICTKALLGGFKQGDNIFWCADCVIRDIDCQSQCHMVDDVVLRLNKLLKPGVRINKKDLRPIRELSKFLKECLQKSSDRFNKGKNE